MTAFVDSNGGPLDPGTLFGSHRALPLQGGIAAGIPPSSGERRHDRHHRRNACGDGALRALSHCIDVKPSVVVYFYLFE